MTVTVTSIDQGPFTATGLAQTVAYTFMTLTDDEISVFYDVGLGRVLIESSDYVVTRNKNIDNSPKEGGSVAISVSAAPAGSSIYVRANPRDDRDIVWSDTGSRLKNLNEEQDRQVLRLLVTKDKLDRNVEGMAEAGSEAGAAAGAAAAAVVLDGKADLDGADFTAQPTLNSRPLLSAPAVHFPVYMDNISVVEGASGGDGITNSAAINAWLLANPGKVLRERPGALYRIGRMLALQEGSRLICESASNRATLYMTTAFSNTDFTQRDTATSCGILASGQTSGSFAPISNIGLENLIIQSDTTDGRALRPLHVRNALNAKIINVEVFGIPCGVGMCLSGVRGDTLIESAYVHDFITNSTAFTGAGFGQLTAIEFDNDLVNGIVSENVRITTPRIDNLTPGAAFIGLYGDQSDGINIARTLARSFVIEGAVISRVNEGLDIFGQENSIIGGTYTDCRGSGIKLIHGAKRNSIISPTIIRPGLNGLVFAGSNTPGVGDTAFNTVSGGVISNANPTNANPGSSTGVRFQPNNGAALNQLPRNNTVTGMALIAGSFSNYGWLDELAAGAGSNNVGEGLDIPTGWVDRRVFAPNAGGTGGVRLKRTTAYTENLT